MSPEIRARLSMLRESFAHSGRYQDWVADWWGRLSINDRRTLLALAGMDDSEAAARRPWKQHLQQNRDELMAECKRIARLVEGLKWA